MSNNLTPLQVCERLIGPIEEIGVAASLDRKSAYRWRHGSEWRDPGDIPHARVMRALLAWSKARNLGLTADHLVRGATEDEIQVILNARKGFVAAAE